MLALTEALSIFPPFSTPGCEEDRVAVVIAVIRYGDLFVLPARRAEEGEEGCGLSDTGPL